MSGYYKRVKIKTKGDMDHDAKQAYETMNIDQFLDHIQRYPLLYNASAEGYGDFDRRRDAFREIEEAMDLPRGIAQVKFKNLLDAYRREKKRRAEAGPGTRAGWAYFDLMKFIDEHVPLKSQIESSNERPVSQYENSPPPQQTTRNLNQKPNPPVIRVVRATEDDDRNFFNSLMPYVKQMSPIVKLQFRNRVNSLIMELLEQPSDSNK